MGTINFLVERDYWKAEAERLKALNAELLAASEEALKALGPVSVGNMERDVVECPACGGRWIPMGEGESHDPGCVTLKVEQAIAKAKG